MMITISHLVEPLRPSVSFVHFDHKPTACLKDAIFPSADTETTEETKAQI